MAKKLRISGVIISNDDKWLYDIFDMDSTSPSDVDKVLDEANGEELEVEINSPGGSVFSGSEIYTKLKSYKGKVTVTIIGVAMSAASVIAMAGDVVRISPTAQIMIHNTSSFQYGDYRDMQHEAGVLENYNKSIANAYMLKTGLSQEELLKYMDEETWFNAKQAKELGFVDEILFDENGQVVASATDSFMFPPKVVNKLRNLLKDNEKKENKGEQVDVESIADVLANKILSKLDSHNKTNDQQQQEGQQQEIEQQEQQQQIGNTKEQLQAKLNLLKLGGKAYE